MVKTALLAILVACFCASAATPTVSITGTVTDTANAGIDSARVYLKKYPDIFAFTNTAGVFSLPSSNAVRNIITRQGRIDAKVRDNRIIFTTVFSGQTMAVDLFTSKGGRVFSTKLSGLAPGDHAVFMPKTAAGIYIARIIAGNDIRLLTIATGLKGGIIAGNNAASMPGSPALHGTSVSAAFVDTLVVTAKSYRHALKGIAGYSEKDVGVVMSKSNPWIVNSYPDEANGMTRILAKDKDFEMGQPDPDIGGKGVSASEQAVHTVSFTFDFWMDRTEVTQKNYADVMSAAYQDFVKPAWPAKYGAGDEYPAYYLSWADAVLYCNARSRKDTLDTVYRYTAVTGKPGELTFGLAGISADMTKNGYRLPTEAEWEYACKGGIFTDFSWGRDFASYPKIFLDSIEMNSFEVWRAISWDKGSASPDYGAHAVAGKIYNYYHLYDLAGNVSEYCHDYRSDFYGSANVTDPTGPATGDAHVIRGGNWGNDPVYLRSANRTFYAPDSSQFFIGFRTVKRIP
jgi:formylglycine-generating enzyme required for sulfatase activity